MDWLWSRTTLLVLLLGFARAFSSCSSGFTFRATGTWLFIFVSHAMASYDLALRGPDPCGAIGRHKSKLLWHHDILLLETNRVWMV
jgi:hypothetical protein